MYCVIQEIELKKPDKHGYARELKSYLSEFTISGIKYSSYHYSYSDERFERPIKKAYKISLHQSYRENGKIKKKQYPLCTVKYYEIADRWFGIYDYCNKKIETVASESGTDPDVIYSLVDVKLNPLIEAIQNEFMQTEEFKTHAEHDRITTLYAVNKMKFAEQYSCDKDKYDQIYDVFGNLMNKSKLDELEEEFKNRQEYEEKSSSYHESYYSNYNNYSDSSYSNDIHSIHSTEDKEMLKQFYRELSKKFHPDANPDTDTSKQMQLINQLKSQWGI